MSGTETTTTTTAIPQTIKNHSKISNAFITQGPNHPFQTLCTLNFAPNIPQSEHFDFDEIVREDATGTEYRIWNAFQCPMAASIVSGLFSVNVGEGSKVLCIACSPRTISFCSDLVGQGGRVYCVTSVDAFHDSDYEMIEKLKVQRSNIVANIRGCANNPEEYQSQIVDKVDTIVNIGGTCQQLEANAKLFLKEEDGRFYQLLKKPEGSTNGGWYDQYINEIRNYFKPSEMITMEPFLQDASVIVGGVKPPKATTATVTNPSYSELEEKNKIQQQEINSLKERIKQLEEELNKVKL